MSASFHLSNTFCDGVDRFIVHYEEFVKKVLKKHKRFKVSAKY